MRQVIWMAGLVGMLCASGVGAEIVRPYETDATAAATQLDALVLARLQAKGLQPAPLCSDEVFLRRAYLDVIGTLPKLAEVQTFLADTSPTKRAKLIDALLARDEFADYWSLKWCDILRVKSEFPIDLWPNAVQCYHRWIRDALAANMPYDQFARALLTSSGSNFRVGPVNFYRAIQGRSPDAIAGAVGLTFMGTRLDKWAPADRANMAAFFSRVYYKHTDEWKEEIVELNPAAEGDLAVVFPDGTKARIAADKDPRAVFADWLLQPNNAWFSRAIANRVWSWFLRRGIIQEPDDIRADNPPSNPELLAYLQKQLVASHYDLRQLYRVILSSRTYQSSSLPHGEGAEAEALFAFYPVRRLDAEVLIDALGYIGGSGEEYLSIVPEPYTFVPPTNRTITLADGSISSHFLETFGRPARDTGLEAERNNQATDAQRLYLLNSTDMERRIARSPVLAQVRTLAGGNSKLFVKLTYAALLSRYPTDAEDAQAQAYFQKQTNGPAAAMDLEWALINSKEFLYRH